MHGRAGSASRPLLHYAEPVGGGGEEWRAGSCLGILSGGGGFFSGKSIPRAGITPNSGKEILTFKT
jgi:hypothetical protein